MNERIEKVNLVMQDTEFVARIAAMEEPEDVQAAFAEKGVELSLQEIDLIARMVIDGSTELDESQLEAISGGIDPLTALAIAEIIVGVAGLFANDMASLNEKRKAQGKRTIW